MKKNKISTDVRSRKFLKSLYKVKEEIEEIRRFKLVDIKKMFLRF